MSNEPYIPRAQFRWLEQSAKPGKVVVVHGPRRVGKTTLIQRYAQQQDPNALMVTGEDADAREYLESQSLAKLKAFVSARQTLVVDEAQYVRQIGLNLKLLTDHVKDLRIIATGSSSFDLAQQMGEPLTGRKTTLLLLPLAQLELREIEDAHETKAHLETRLIYGSYPQTVLMDANEERALYIKELVSSYLLKDILQLEGVRHADKLLRLLQLLAFQLGQEASVTELGGQLGMSRNTVERYLDLLEKTYVIHARQGFSRNQRKEVSKSRRYYFYDNGIRNGLINNFNPLGLRGDIGALWENYIVAERLKRNLCNRWLAESYFWRTYDRQEIDLVEECNGRLLAAEIKWSPRAAARARAPASWHRNYPDSAFQLVHQENYLDFIVAEPGG